MQYRAAEHQHWKHPRKAPPLSTVVQPEAPSWGDLEMARCKSHDNDRDRNDGWIVTGECEQRCSFLAFLAAIKARPNTREIITVLGY